MLEDDIGGIGEAVLITIAEVGDVLSSLALCHLLGRYVGTYTARDGDIALPSRRLVARGRILDISANDDRVFLVISATLLLRHLDCLSCAKSVQTMAISNLYIPARESIQKWRSGPRRKQSQIRPFAINNGRTWTCSPCYQSYQSIG